MYIKELTNEEFNKFSNSFNNNSLYQTPEYAFVMNKQGFDTLFLGLIDDNSIVAASLILVEKRFGFKHAFAPRGFLLDYNNTLVLETFTHEIKKYLGKCDIISVKICPLIIKNRYDMKHKVIENNSYYDSIFENLKKLDYFHMGYNSYFEALKPRFEAIIDLNVPYYMLFKNIKKEVRAKIRNAEKYGVKIYRGNSDNIDYLYLQTKQKYPRDIKYFKDVFNFFSKNKQVEFYYARLDTNEFLKKTQINYALEEENNNRLNQAMVIYSSKNPQKLMNKKLKSDAILEKYKKQIIMATTYLKNYPEGIVLASGLIVKNQNNVQLLIDGYDKNYSFLNAKYLLIWKLIEKYANQGYDKFNLGGVADINSPKEYKGLNECKISYNAKIVEYIGDLELVTNNGLYFMYKQSAPIRGILKR